MMTDFPSHIADRFARPQEDPPRPRYLMICHPKGVGDDWGEALVSKACSPPTPDHGPRT